MPLLYKPSSAGCSNTSGDKMCSWWAHRCCQEIGGTMPSTWGTSSVLPADLSSASSADLQDGSHRDNNLVTQSHGTMQGYDHRLPFKTHETSIKQHRRKDDVTAGTFAPGTGTKQACRSRLANRFPHLQSPGRKPHAHHRHCAPCRFYL